MRRLAPISCADPVKHGLSCDCLWVEQQLELIPFVLRKTVLNRYKKIENRAERNTFLRELVTTSHAAKFKNKDFVWSEDVEKIDRETGEILTTIKKTKVDLSLHMRDLASKTDADICALTKSLASLEHIWKPLKAYRHARLEPRLRRYLRQAAHQQSEMFALTLRLVHAGGQEYASAMSHRRREQQLITAQEWAEQTEVVTSAGDRVILAQIIKNSKSQRIAQIYKWAKGLETHSRGLGLIPMFLTITCRPEHHPNPGNRNNNWDGTTPAEAQTALMNKFAILRAILAKDDITLSGPRVAEPHKDGCPHGHMLAFVRPEDCVRIEEAIRSLWKTEVAAQIKYLDNETEDGKKASAASYLMKYVFKTLCNGNDGNNDKLPKKEKEDKQDTWRSTWGIRAIQWLGLPTKQTWEALRRLPPDHARDPSLSLMRYAAQSGNYSLFLELDGGVGIKRKNRLLKTQIEPDKNLKIINFRIQNQIVSIWQRAKAKIERIKNGEPVTKNVRPVTVVLHYPSKPKNQGQNPGFFVPPTLLPAITLNSC